MNTRLLIYFVVLASTVGLLGACANWDFGDLVKVDTPIGIQKRDGLPARMSLNEAEEQYPAWRDDVQRDDATWRANISEGSEFAGLLSSFSLQQLNDAGPMIAGIPVAGPGLVGGAGLLGVLLGRMGTGREKRNSFNKGIEVGANARAAGTNQIQT